MSNKKGNLFTRLLSNIKINEQTDCWEWQLATNNIGYGFIRGLSGMQTTHRLSYELHNNIKIPRNMCVCHTCDNKICVNPDHLWLGTRKQNVKDMINKGRHNFFGGKTNKGLKHKRYVCVHCNRDFSLHMLNLWHNENCRHKPQE